MESLPLNPRVLFIEDDADTRELVSFVLTRENFEVVLATDSEEALLAAGAMSFELYLIDNWLPGESGVDLCKRLREFDRRTPILFYSGAAYEHDKRAAFAAGAQGYLTKPSELGELVQEVSQLIYKAA
ncbi:MAG TPA: response regulator [Pyrinomonadaceae bacterium]|nr:response regulator [Pyrinomonadaceae bacterium]